MIVLQSPISGLPPCPSGTFKNSQQRARVIYGWVIVHNNPQVPLGTTEIMPGLSCLKESVFIRAHPWLKKIVEIAKRTQFSMQLTVVQKETKKKFPIL